MVSVFSLKYLIITHYYSQKYILLFKYFLKEAYKAFQFYSFVLLKYFSKYRINERSIWYEVHPTYEFSRESFVMY